MEQLLDRIAKAPLAAKLGGLVGLVAVITALNFFLVIQPIEDTIAQQQTQQRSLDQQLAEKQEIAQNLNERRREMDVLQQKLDEALTELPETKDIDDLLAQLNDVGKKSGLTINLVQPGGEQPVQFFARIPIKMTVMGNYHEIAMFLQEVSHLRRIVNVSDIKLASPSTSNEKVVLKSDFLATTFRFLDKPQKSGDKKGKAR